MIPKQIHLIWFGSDNLPEQVNLCIESWRHFMPDYEIVRWDESNFDVNQNNYCREAYEAKKWAFVSDYARFKILFDHGGIYLDTDVELLKPLNELLAKGPLMACESNRSKSGKKSAISAAAPGLIPAVNPGLILAVNPGLPLYKEIIDSYESDHFLLDDGTFNLRTVVERTSDILYAHGLVSKPCIQKIAGITIYPEEYFCPMDHMTGKIRITNKTVAFHHYSATWQSEVERELTKRRYKLLSNHPHMPVTFAGLFAKIGYARKSGNLNPLIESIRKKLGH